jgi:hypothetical protein
MLEFLAWLIGGCCALGLLLGVHSHMANPYRDSEVVTDRAATYTWSFKLGFVDVMKPDDRGNLTELGVPLVVICFSLLLAVLVFGGYTAKNVVQLGLGVPWVKRELIVWCCSMAFWFAAFIRPYISKTRE